MLSFASRLQLNNKEIGIPDDIEPDFVINLIKQPVINLAVSENENDSVSESTLANITPKPCTPLIEISNPSTVDRRNASLKRIEMSPDSSLSSSQDSPESKKHDLDLSQDELNYSITKAAIKLDSLYESKMDS